MRCRRATGVAVKTTSQSRAHSELCLGVIMPFPFTGVQQMHHIVLGTHFVPSQKDLDFVFLCAGLE
jgi:hypothetical protein